MFLEKTQPLKYTIVIILGCFSLYPAKHRPQSKNTLFVAPPKNQQKHPPKKGKVPYPTLLPYPLPLP